MPRKVCGVEFQKVLKLIESPNYKAVLVVEISRLGRPDMEEIGRLSKTFRYTNTLVITPMRIFNVADEYDYRKNSIYKTFLACDSVSDEVLLHKQYVLESGKILSKYLIENGDYDITIVDTVF